MLECLDGADDRTGVVVIGATNYPEALDAALLRPGRLDRHIRLSLPDAPSRVAILERYLGFKFSAKDCLRIVDATENWSGAMLEKQARTCRQFARDHDREVKAADIISLLPETTAISEERLATTAIHESGHALVGLALGQEIERIRIAERYAADATSVVLGGVLFKMPVTVRRTASVYCDEICVSLAGIAAEHLLFGAHDDGVGGTSESDLGRATRLATLVEGVNGMGRTLISEFPGQEEDLALLRLRNPELWWRIDALLTKQMDRAKAIVQTNRQILDRLAEVLLERKSISGAELSEFLLQRHCKIELPDTRRGTTQGGQP